jgi:hypothetical protein
MDNETELILSKIKLDNPGFTPTDLSRRSGVPLSSVRRWAARVKRKAMQGHAPDYDMTHQVPDGFIVKRISTNYGPDGELRQQWVKSDIDKEKAVEAMQIAVEAIIEPCRGLAVPVEQPASTNRNLLTCYPIPEPHIGLYCWDEEVGTNYDTDIAVKHMTDSFSYLVDASPPSETCIILNLADLMHMDNESGKTERSGHDLDVDTRWGRVIRKAAQGLRGVIAKALTKHKTVYYKSGKGNHDDKASIFFALMLEAYFENEPRVIIQVPNNPFAYHEFGVNLFGVNHGDLKGVKNLPLIMATDQPQAWGRTTYRTFFIGHRHHKEIIEHPGCTVEMLRTIAPSDAHAQRQGYRHLRSSEAITYDIERGEISRVIKNITEEVYK